MLGKNFNCVYSDEAEPESSVGTLIVEPSPSVLFSAVSDGDAQAVSETLKRWPHLVGVVQCVLLRRVHIIDTLLSLCCVACVCVCVCVCVGGGGYCRGHDTLMQHGLIHCNA